MPGIADSLGLAGARQAFRRFFRRGWLPGDDSDASDKSSTSGSTSGEDDGPAPPPPPPNTPASQHENSLAQDKPPHADSDKNLDPSTGDDDDFANDTFNDSSTMSFNTASPGASRQLASPKGKENQQPSAADSKVDALTEQMAILKASQAGEGATASAATAEKPAAAAEDVTIVVVDDPAVLAERAVHLKFIGEALDMAKLALRTNETPVGCVLVHNGKVIAKGMNATNVTRNGTRHAELMAIGALLSVAGKTGPKTTCLKPKVPPKKVVREDGESDTASTESEWRSPDEGNEDGSKGHLYPYGQKMVAEERVDRSILRECTLYVTVEPCVMCASLLRQFGIQKVYFGAVNDKFGGTGGVFNIHANFNPMAAASQDSAADAQTKPVRYSDGGGSLTSSSSKGCGDGGNVEHGYEVYGGWARDEAVALLRRFYVQENGRAPVPRKKEGRAARLAAMMEQDGKDAAENNTGGVMKENVAPGNTENSAPGKEN
ncbi:cmp dcmp deaminase, zinc-binding [Trichoderma arundinaceum]|uniref:Cmp dcmp deaminase, zinc-binding n=1 Tax=Trichoderma arundinaceum TaxID=490622 RepID=A0A395NU72_TRIAR|nr:cmp dcmp deaminase, zinc-binding [Trichoderma arundinaceum]